MVTIGNRQSRQKFSSNYILSRREKERLLEILVSDDSAHAPFLISLIKELDGNLDKILRVLTVGINSNSRTIPVSVYNTFIIAIKEAIVLSNYQEYKTKDGFISIVDMAKTERFKLAYVDRQTIIRTFNKYNISYNKRR